MSTPSHKIYDFLNFRFDAEKFVLYHHGELVSGASQKPLEVLGAILSAGNDVASYDEIIARVWPDNIQGADSLRINQYISQLRRLLSACEPNVQFIENIKGRGYRFLVPVSHGAGIRKEGAISFTGAAPAVERSRFRSVSKWLLSAVLLAGAIFLVSAFWLSSPDDDEESVRKLLKESQLFESLVLYRDPDAVTEKDLDRYWTGGAAMELNHDRKRILESVNKMRSDGLKYGDGTKCEQFDIQSMSIDNDKTFATVRTLEKWFIAVYEADGTPQKNRTVGPYFVDYIMRKIDGRWLVEKSSTARVIRPVPRLIDVEAITQPVSGSEFLIRITGHDLEPATVFLQLVGPGCPESKPCKLSNATLLERAKLTDVVLENVPLELASGNFRISAHNGESQPSNFVYLQVP